MTTKSQHLNHTAMFNKTVDTKAFLAGNTVDFNHENAKLFMGEASLAAITTHLPGSDVPQNIKGIVNHQFNDQLIDLSREGYQLVSNKQLVEQFYEASKSFNFNLRINSKASYVKPERMRLSLLTDKVIFNDGESDALQSIEIINSYNRTFAIGVKFSAVRVACMNGMVSSRMLAQTKAKHIKSTNVNDLIDNLLEADEVGTEMASGFAKLRETRVDMDELETALWLEKYIGKRGAKQAVEAMGSDMPKTQWDLYNAATYYITHHSPEGEGQMYKGLKLAKDLQLA